MRWSSLKSEMFSHVFIGRKNAAVIYITYSVIYITAALLLCRKNIAHHAKEAQKYRQKVQEETDAYHHGAEEG